MIVAQTNIQLYNQLRREQRSMQDLQTVQRAYEFITTIYGGYLQADGKPFLAHSAGVASIVAQLGAPIEFVVAGLGHNIYGNGDFGDGRSFSITPGRRALVTQALGAEVEGLIARFPQYRITLDTIDGVVARLDDFTDDERLLLAIDLADHLEKHVDLGILYYGDNAWARAIVEQRGAQLVEIADRLGYPALASGLTDAFAAVAAEKARIPDEVRRASGRRYLTLVVPRSCRRRLLPAVVSRVRKWTGLVQRGLQSARRTGRRE